MPQSPGEANEFDRESHALPLRRIQWRWQNHLRPRYIRQLEPVPRFLNADRAQVIQHLSESKLEIYIK